MVAKTQDETLSYGGQSLTLHAMKGDFCPACGDGIWDEESYLRYTEAQSAIVRAVNGDVSADMRRIRKNLKLTQTELSEVVGIGKVTFSRYERGETKPPNPLVKLLKLVEKHPDLLCRNVSHLSQSKPHSLEYFRKIEQTGEELVITDHGRPVLKVVRYVADPEECFRGLRNTVLHYDAPLEPVC